MDIQRYHLTYYDEFCQEHQAIKTGSESGPYVLFTDHKAAVEAKDAEIAELNRKLKRWQERAGVQDPKE